VPAAAVFSYYIMLREKEKAGWSALTGWSRFASRLC